VTDHNYLGVLFAEKLGIPDSDQVHSVSYEINRIPAHRW
jgi:hypothetical protein